MRSPCKIISTIIIVFLFIPFLSKGQIGEIEISEFYEASNEFNLWFHQLSTPIMLIGAITGFVGGLRVYTNWQTGKHHIDAQVMGWVFSCLFLTLISLYLQNLFGVH